MESKRGPRNKKALPAAKPLSVALRPMRQIPDAERSKIANEVLDRYINGEQVAAIAPVYGVSDVTMYALLLREHEEAWKDVQKARALARLETAQRDLALAPDALSLARARELVRSAQWELERLLSRLYAQKQEVRVDVNVNLADRLIRARERVVAEEPQVAAQQPAIIDVVPTQPLSGI